MKKRNIVLALALSCLMVMSIFTGCAKPAAPIAEAPATEAADKPAATEEKPAETVPAELPVIRIGCMPYYSGAPAQVILDEKLDEKFGFKLKVVVFPSGGPMAEALGANEWDVGPIGAGGMVAVPNYGARLVADVHYETDACWLFARPGSDIVKAGNTVPEFPDVIGDAASVKGKTMLGTFGNISQYFGVDYLNKLGLKIEDVNFLHMEISQIYTAFVSGQGDLAAVGSPSAAYKLKMEGYPVVGGLTQQGISQQDALLISEDMYLNHKDLSVQFLKAWFTATGMMNADIEYQIQKCLKFYTENGRSDVTEESVRQECESSSYVDVNNFGKKEVGKWMKGLVEFMVGIEAMPKEIIDGLNINIDPSLSEQAIAELKK